jgi:FAD/FMN-containing dehydrogenase
LKQLFVGSEGTLGIITAAVLKLYPKARVSATAFAALAHVEAAIALLAELKQALGDRLTGFELVSRACIELTRAQFPAFGDPLPGHPWYALIQADDPAEASPLTAQLEAALAAAVDSGTARDATIAQSAAQGDALWSLREHIPEAQRREGRNLKHDISVAVSRVPAFLREAQARLDAALPGVRYVIFGHLGDGNLHYNLSPPAGVALEAFRSETARANRIVYDLVVEMGGSFSAEHGIGQLKREELTRYKAEVEVDLMRRIKRALDPGNLLNPGKVV